MRRLEVEIALGVVRDRAQILRVLGTGRVVPSVEDYEPEHWWRWKRAS